MADTEQVDDSHNKMKTYVLAIESAIKNSTGISGSSDLSSIYDQISRYVIGNISLTLPFVDNYLPNRINANSGIDLIYAALGTARNTGILIAKYFEEHDLIFTCEEDIVDTIKPFIRDLLRFNLDFNHLVRSFSLSSYTHGISLNERNELQIVGPSYLNNAKILSSLFEDQSKVNDFIIEYNTLANNKDNDSEYGGLVQAMGRVLICNPSEIFNSLNRALSYSNSNSIHPLSGLINYNNPKLMSLVESLNNILMFGYFRDDPKAYLMTSDLIIKNIDTILVECPLKDEIRRLVSSKTFFPVVFNIENLDRTVGCPAYFHNVAVNYVAKGLALKLLA